jgi:hypothetical protein
LLRIDAILVNVTLELFFGQGNSGVYVACTVTFTTFTMLLLEHVGVVEQLAL